MSAEVPYLKREQWCPIPEDSRRVEFDRPNCSGIGNESSRRVRQLERRVFLYPFPTLEGVREGS